MMVLISARSSSRLIMSATTSTAPSSPSRAVASAGPNAPTLRRQQQKQQQSAHKRPIFKLAIASPFRTQHVVLTSNESNSVMSLLATALVPIRERLQHKRADNHKRRRSRMRSRPRKRTKSAAEDTAIPTTATSAASQTPMETDAVTSPKAAVDVVDGGGGDVLIDSSDGGISVGINACSKLMEQQPLSSSLSSRPTFVLTSDAVTPRAFLTHLTQLCHLHQTPLLILHASLSTAHIGGALLNIRSLSALALHSSHWSHLSQQLASITSSSPIVLSRFIPRITWLNAETISYERLKLVTVKPNPVRVAAKLKAATAAKAKLGLTPMEAARLARAQQQERQQQQQQQQQTAQQPQ